MTADVCVCNRDLRYGETAHVGIPIAALAGLRESCRAPVCDVINCAGRATHVLVITGHRVCAKCAASLKNQGCTVTLL